MKYTELLKKSKNNLPNDYAPIRDNFQSTQKVASIIESQFGVFGKGDSQKNNLLDSVPYLDEVRCNHIVNTFLFGVFLYENSIVIKNQIDYSIKKYETADFRKDFCFFWFLICLFHDLGYAEENKREKSDVFSYNLEMIGSLGNVDGVPAFFKEVYPFYFIYRKLGFGVVDHGIFAGLKMYPDLCNIREEHARNNSNPKFWREELIPIYNLASWVVLAHNIWFAKDTKRQDLDTYRRYGLERLVLETKSEEIKQKQTQVVVDYPIKMEECPFLFLFCLVDLVEPMKKIGKMECCEKIDINITDQELTITSNLDCACGEQYLKHLSGAGDWLMKTNRENNAVIFRFKDRNCKNNKKIYK